MSKAPHVCDKDLIRFSDGEMHGQAEVAVKIHLQACASCRARLEELQSAAMACAEYHTHILKASLDHPREWPRLQVPPADVERPKSRFSWPALSWAAPVVACCLVIVLFLYRDTPHRKMTRLLSRASAVPPLQHGRLKITSNGQSWYRAAVLRTASGKVISTEEPSGMQHTHALFVKANYSWDNPLSARSFAAWRSRLRDKRDQVTSIRSDDRGERLYRLRTETSHGILRVASLTLHSDTLDPVRGAFHFEDQEEVTITEAGAMPESRPELTAKKAPAGRPIIETKVTPKEELRVFAALNSIGADAGEPLTVDVDPSKHHIVVSGVGIPREREQEIRQALAGLPKTTLNFDSGRPARAANPVANAGTYSVDTSAPLRRTMEAQAGGAQNFQLITDQALTASSSLLAQAHALYVLSQAFPPGVESIFTAADRQTLGTLRRHHAIAIEQAISHVRQSLAPLLSRSGKPPNQPQLSWHANASQLLQESKLLDQSLSRLLAGSYSQRAGEDILSRLPDEIQNTDALARSQEVIP